MDITLLTLMTALGLKAVATIKFAEERDWKSLRTQVTAWLVGVGVVFLGAESDWAADYEVNGTTLEALNSASKVILGMSFLSVGGVVHDFIKGVNKTSEAPIINNMVRMRRPLTPNSTVELPED